MPMLRITATDQEPRLHDSSGRLMPVLRHALGRDPGPVTIMVHGFKYQPGLPGNCPHQTLFSPCPETRHAHVTSWPRHLGLRGQHGDGLGISFGWPARCSIWEAHRRAEIAGHALGHLVAMIREIAPDRPVNAVGHSLGARVILSAVRTGQSGAITRAILLAAAEYGETAQVILSAPRGRRTQVLNVTSRENDLFDFLLERLVAPEIAGDRMLGHAAPRLPNLVTLQLDDATSLDALHDAGFPIAPPERRVCHWSPYLRPGVFPLYRAVLSGTLPFQNLKALLPEARSPRWSRLLARRVALPASPGLSAH